MTIQSLASLGTGLVNRQAFKQHALEDGGVYWLPDQPLERLIYYLPLDVVQQSWLESPERSEAYGLLQVTAGYTQVHTPNGACSIEKGEHCISLTRGLVLHMLRICSVAARHPSIFADLPDHGSAFPPELQMDEWFRWDTAVEQNLFVELALPNVIKAPFRQRLAFLLLFDALHIAWLHEAFHVVLGHAGFLRKHKNRLRMNEQVKSSGRGQKEDKLYQALEFEADHTAMRMATDLAQKGADPVYQTIAPELSMDQRLGALLMAGCFLTLGWSAMEQHYNHRSLIHPPPHVRYYTMILAHSDRSESYMGKNHIQHIQRWAFQQFGFLIEINPFYNPLAHLGEQSERKKADQMMEVFKHILSEKQESLNPYQYR
jgi:hypothetical protein